MFPINYIELYTPKEERWNVISHALGIVFCVAGLFLLIYFNTNKTEYSLLAILMYSFSSILLYTASTAYHWVQRDKWKATLRKLDHISIYFLIAGTYSPVALISLEGKSGWLIFWVVWGITVFGTILKIFFTGRFEKISLMLYLLMGWFIVFYINDVIASQSFIGLFFLFLGGAFYTLGTIFYAKDRIPYNHAIWHFFVLAGSVSHYCFIFLDVI